MHLKACGLSRNHKGFGATRGSESIKRLASAVASKSTIKRRLVLAGVFLGLSTVFALLSSLGNGSIRELHQHVPWGPLLRQQFKNWYMAGLLALVAVWLCGRHRLERGQVKGWALLHVAAGCGFSCMYMLGTAWLVAGEQSVMHPGQTLTFSYLMKRVGGEYFALGTVVYWMTVFGHVIWDYYQRFRQREIHTTELQRQVTEARLEALRMQLNPHFLFNTLHAISALIHEQPEAADRMVVRLSELLRVSLDPSKPQEVALSEEMAFLAGYLEIEQTRFSERLAVTKDIEPGTETALVPFLLLQPLVENAIRHGIEPREEPGRLAITARRQDGRLELRVRDDGPGLAEDGRVPQGIGLSNTRSRLRHLYGEQFSFDLRDLPEGGLEARISLPFRTHATTS